MALNLFAILKESKYNQAVKLNELKDYGIVLKYPNKIKNGDIVLNAGLTAEISPRIYDTNSTNQFLSEIYGIFINKTWSKSSSLYEIYSSARSAAGDKNGLERALAIANSLYIQLYYRMMEYTDSYSKDKGIMTNSDLLYLEGNNQRKGEAISLDGSLIHGPFLCHEFAVTLSVLLNREKTRTGLKAFYTMGWVEREGEKAEHCWVELRNRKGERILLDPISNVVEYLNKNENYLISANGVKYWIDNGPLILRKKSLTK
ncbi:DUF356 domain-containing protein [Candidatus Parvarchaeota archaeon]|nr:DUF356 domain-containing protein [Candidatus Parvarchaeota archaeon]